MMGMETASCSFITITMRYAKALFLQSGSSHVWVVEEMCRLSCRAPNKRTRARGRPRCRRARAASR